MKPLVDPELLAFTAEVRDDNARQAAAMKVYYATMAGKGPAEVLAMSRAMMEPGGLFGQKPSDAATERTIPGPAGDIALRVFEPAGAPGAVYLSIHGGGFTIGSRRSGDQLNERLARSCGVVVVSPEYRLGPEHPYPAGHDDCETAAKWLVDHAASEWGTGRLLIGGESAGAALAASTLLRMRDRHGAAGRFAGANLNCGCYDMTGTPSWWLPPDPDSVLMGGRRLAAEYFTDPDRLREPDISPLYADLRGLCPALFTVGTADPLLDDSVFLAARWQLAGNEADLRVYPDGPHGMGQSRTEMGRRAVAAIEDFLCGCAQP